MPTYPGKMEASGPTGDLQFFFPGNFYIGHDGSVNPWPVDNEGRDLSLYKQ